MSVIYFDIETGPLPLAEREFARPDEDSVKYGNTKDEAKRKVIFDKAIADWEENGNALDPLQSQVVAIGTAEEDSDTVALDYIAKDRNEAKLLTSFWADCASTATTLIGHYIQALDLPFMVKRSRILDISFPGWVHKELCSYMPDVDRIFDTRLCWTLSKQEHISLKKLAGACGYPCKTGECSGEFFWKFLRDGKMDECDEYLTDDVLAVKAIYETLFA